MPSHPLLSEPLVPFPPAEPQSHGARPSASWPLGRVEKGGERATGPQKRPARPARLSPLPRRTGCQPPSFWVTKGEDVWEASGIGASGLPVAVNS